MNLLKYWHGTVVTACLALVAVAGCIPSAPSLVSSGAESPSKPAAKPGATTARRVVLKISGSGAISTLLTALEPAFEAATPGYHLDILPGTETGGGVQATIKGVLDVAAMARPPKAEEVAQDVQYADFGKGPVAVFTHPNVGITSLTKEHLAAIFAGMVTNWSAVGGPDLPIVVYVRNEDESSTKVLRTAVFGDTPFPPTIARLLSSHDDMLRAVANTPGSVGFGAWVVVRVKQAKVRPIALNGVAPGDAAYPVVTPLGLGYLQPRQADVQPLIDWLRSKEGQIALRAFDVIVAQQ